MSRPDRIIEKIFIKGDFVLDSPLMVCSGQGVFTDKDVIKDAAGKAFIPGQTLAGVLRSHLAGNCAFPAEPELLKVLFGPKTPDGAQSLISIYDACCNGSGAISRRDGLKRDWITRTAEKGAKYDYEVVEPGTIFTMRFETTFREVHRPSRPDLKHELFLMLSALCRGDIRLGAKTRRGFGRGRMENLGILMLSFDPCPVDSSTIDRWTSFSWDTFEADPTINLDAFEKADGRSLNISATVIHANFVLSAGLLLAGGVSDSADAQQLKSALGFVIPGTSWAGAVKNQIMKICRDLNIPERLHEDSCNRFPVVRDLFGYVDKNSKQAKASRIRFEETVLPNGSLYLQNRNRIDRFTGGTVEGGLFDEAPVNGNGVEIELAVRIEDAKDYEIGLVLLALRDIGAGIQPMGGTVNVGRGILKHAGIRINDNELDFEGDAYRSKMDALYTYCTSDQASTAAA